MAASLTWFVSDTKQEWNLGVIGMVSDFVGRDVSEFLFVCLFVYCIVLPQVYLKNSPHVSYKLFFPIHAS